MRACVLGTGAVGGHIAARLAAGGAEVSAIARGPVLEALRSSGLRVTAGDWSFEGRLAAVESDPARLGPQDVVFVTVKAPSLPEIAAGLASLLDPETIVVFVTNGIPWWYFGGEKSELSEMLGARLDPDGALAATVGHDRVVGSLIYSACSVETPGLVRVHSKVNRIIMGMADDSGNSRLQVVADILSAGGFDVDVTQQIRKPVWEKLVVNLGSGLPSVLTQRALGHIYSDPEAAELVRGISEEVASIARAMGENVHSKAESRISYGRTSPHRMSMLQDLDAGRPMEIDALCVLPLEIARHFGLDVPLLSALVPLMRLRAQEAGLYPAS